jgi:hypothetical protein
MIPADGSIYALFKMIDGGYPCSEKVLAWDDEGRPLVMGDKSLVLAEERTDLVFEGLKEAPWGFHRPPHVYDDEGDGQLPVMQDQTITALRNYDWLIRNTRDGLEEVGLHFESDTVTVRDGGYAIQALCEAGFTPATRPEQPQEKEAVTLPANSRFRSSR